MRTHVLLLTLLALSYFAQAQEGPSRDYQQTIRGRVVDQVSKTGLPGASVSIPETDPLLGTTTDLNGHFVLSEIPTGRVNLKISYVGYEDAFLNQIPVTSGKEVI